MPETSNRVTLRTGETVDLAIVRTPDRAWAARIEAMLLHKGDPWNWQNSELLRRETGADSTFFVLHRDGAPFANVMLMQSGSVGLLGHVWTAPADRGGGASSLLLDCLLTGWRARGGTALFLGTEFDSVPWHYYRRRGFAPVEPGSGFMERYAESRAAFEAAWFGAIDDVVIEPLDWPHLVASVPLFLGDFEENVRLASTRLIGRRVSDEALLPLLRGQAARRHRGQPSSALVLRARASTAIVGLACWRADSAVPATAIVDVYCHPAWWHRAADVLSRLSPPPELGAVAYAGTPHSARHVTLRASGFSPLPHHIPSTPGGPPIGVTVFTRAAATRVPS